MSQLGVSVRANLLICFIFLVSPLFSVLGGVGKPSMGWAYLACSVAQLATAILLSTGRHLPAWLARSALGQALSSQGLLAMGVLLIAGRSLGAGVSWTLLIVGGTALASGLIIEGRTQQAEPAQQP